MPVILLTNGMRASVDEEDFAYLSQWSWSAARGKRTYYAVRRPKENGKQKNVWMHRVVLGRDEQCDHVNRNGLDNRRANLRSADCSQNGVNRDYSWRGRDIPYRGIYRRPSGRWTVTVRHDGNAYNFGTYAEPEEAARVFDREALRLHGEFAVLNFGGSQL